MCLLLRKKRTCKTVRMITHTVTSNIEINNSAKQAQ